MGAGHFGTAINRPDFSDVVNRDSGRITMKITDIRATVPIEAKVPQDWRGWFAQILVMVESEDGSRGYGMGGGGEAGTHVVNTALRHELVGADATAVEELWDHMYRSTLAYGRKGLALMAISGVDLALWDLRGRREGKPIVELLGGSTSGSPLPVYKTTGLDDIPLDPDEGFAAYKGHYDPAAPSRGAHHPNLTATEQRCSVLFCVYLALVVSYAPDITMYLCLRPKGADEVAIRWGIAAHVADLSAEVVEGYVAWSKELNGEDRTLLEAIQIGLKSRYYVPGPLAASNLEGTVWDLYQFMARRFTERPD